MIIKEIGKQTIKKKSKRLCLDIILSQCLSEVIQLRAGRYLTGQISKWTVLFKRQTNKIKNKI